MKAYKAGTFFYINHSNRYAFYIENGMMFPSLIEIKRIFKKKKNTKKKKKNTIIIYEIKIYKTVRDHENTNMSVFNLRQKYIKHRELNYLLESKVLTKISLSDATQMILMNTNKYYIEK